MRTRDKDKRREYYLANKEKFLARSRAYYHANKDAISQKSKAKWAAMTKEERQIKTKKCHDAYPEKRKEYSRKYYQEHKDAIKRKAAEWNNNNKDRKNARLRLWSKAYKSRKPDVRIYNSCRRMLARILHRYIDGKNITVKTEQLIGCTLDDLAKHLASKFKDGMTMDNYGKWHIDHIIPLSAFTFDGEDDIKRACHFSNLQPLWAFDNISKGAKVS